VHFGVVDTPKTGNRQQNTPKNAPIMAKQIVPLTDTGIRRARAVGRPANLFDGGGLYLVVSPSGSKLWRFKYQFCGKSKTMSFGPYPDVTLKHARELHQEARSVLAGGIDPMSLRKAKKVVSEDIIDTFRSVAEEWLAQMSSRWVDGYTRTVAQRLQNDAYPAIGALLIADITPQDIIGALRVVEGRGAIESAHRVRLHISQVFDYAIISGKAIVNPAARLSRALQTPKVRHMAAITDPEEFGRLLSEIDAYQGAYPTKCALRLAPMLFVRPGELRGMEWAELDLDEAIWRIPAARMKMKQSHAVPLARQAVDILSELRRYTGTGRYVFPGRSGARPISNNTINAALRYLGWGRDVVTGHGFRATARTLLHEVLKHSPDAIEAQLAHRVPDRLGAAYNRTKHMDERIRMMQEWADYLDRLRS